MATSLYLFSEAEAKTAKPLTVNMFIKNVLRSNGDACYVEMERYLMPPGVSGSKAFDQAYAVGILLKHDAMEDNGGRIADVMDQQGMSRRLLWDRLQSVLRQVGFQMKHGRLIGLLEGPAPKTDKDENGDIGQPDID